MLNRRQYAVLYIAAVWSVWVVQSGCQRTEEDLPVGQQIESDDVGSPQSVTVYLLAVFVRSHRQLGSDLIARPLASDAGRDQEEVQSELGRQDAPAPSAGGSEAAPTDHRGTAT